MKSDIETEEKPHRMRFSLRLVLLTVFLVASSIALWKWQRHDTILHCDLNALVKLPSGRTVPTNSWFSGRDFPFELQPTDNLSEVFIIDRGQNAFEDIDFNESKLATLVVDGNEFLAMVSDSEVDSSTIRNRGEFWVRKGKPVAKPQPR